MYLRVTTLKRGCLSVGPFISLFVGMLGSSYVVFLLAGRDESAANYYFLNLLKSAMDG